MKSKLALAIVLGLLGCQAAVAQKTASDQFIRFYQWRVSRDPGESINYDNLGSAYLQKARESGDPVYYELAEKSYVQALALLEKDKPEAAGSITHLAALYLSEHRFHEATALANQALTLDSEILSAYAILGDAQLETGQYKEAASSYAKLKVPTESLPPRPGLTFLSETRQAGLGYIEGRPRESVEHMQVAIAKAIAANLPKENVAWSQFSLGELYYGMGDFAGAETSYQAALKTYSNYHRALAWLGQLRAAQGRYAEAAELYHTAVEIIPLPIYAAALGDVYKKMGRKEEARKAYELVDVIAKLSALNQQLFRRELATFYADHDLHLAESLEFATEELAARQDVYTWDVLAWAYFKNGKNAEARDAIAHALAQGTKDPLIFFHAGMIYEKTGDSAKATEYLDRALAINAHFHIFHAETARETLARLARKDVPSSQQEAFVAH